ncbi:hypothetical protein FQS96_13635 [Enterococcus faecalis]|uniref:SdpI family protein n=1 Tax=Enterococcus TaxID=1350 RepID=UPI001928CD87|nr:MULTISPECIES: SdpI family protein [Enterococcus]MBO1126478.1 hypothetical protein [Enterococcus faecalis]MBO6371807.1 hypothetical protein [Enterococcus faecalis]MBO6379806.1 hypothetical protein [Enterococcus faecalis]MBO6383640.1 hypothetical protein [Enterococcus faecalis]MDV2932527.1 SdpI family protein [Enterococcus faecalis]
MNIYSYFILIVAVVLLINIIFFDNSQNAGIGFRTKESMASKTKWVFSQKIFYGVIILISLLAIILNHFHIILERTSVLISVIGIVVAGTVTQITLVLMRKRNKNKRKK